MCFGHLFTQQQYFWGLKKLTFENVFQSACLHVNYKNKKMRKWWHACYVFSL